MSTDHHMDDDTLAAWALNALDASETQAVDDAVANDHDVGRRAAVLLEIASRLHTDSSSDDLPVASGIVRRALTDRAAGRSLLSPMVGASLREVHRQIADDAEAFVATLTEPDLAQPTRLNASAREVIAHIVGQLDKTATELGDGEFPTFTDDEYEHWRATGSYRDRYATADGPTLSAALAAMNRRISERLAALEGTETLGDQHTVGSLASRTLGKFFELWMHVDDVRIALGRPTVAPDAAAMLSICTLAATILPYGMDATGHAHAGRSLRLVLTGPGGGTWLCPLAPGETATANADVTLVADGVTFCRLFHRQVLPADVPSAVEGDRALADAVLAGAQAFAERT